MADLDNSPENEHEPSLSARRILALGRDASWSINGIAGVWVMVVLAVFALPTTETVFPRMMGVVVLGILPAAIAFCIASITRTLFAWLSMVCDPIDHLAFSIGCGIVFCSIISYGGLRSFILRQWPQLRALANEVNKASRRMGEALFLFVAPAIRWFARFLIRVSAARNVRFRTE